MNNYLTIHKYSSENIAGLVLFSELKQVHLWLYFMNNIILIHSLRT